MTTDGGSAGTAGDHFRTESIPAPRDRSDAADPAEPGARREKADKQKGRQG